MLGQGGRCGKRDQLLIFKGRFQPELNRLHRIGAGIIQGVASGEAAGQIRHHHAECCGIVPWFNCYGNLHLKFSPQASLFAQLRQKPLAQVLA